jgi:hypothetical protein
MTSESLLPELDETDMLRTARLSEDGAYRFALHRIWGKSSNLLTFIMLNPSTADALVDDPTIVRCVGFARDMGHDGIVVVNLYAYRATKPSDLWLAAMPTGGKQNDETLRKALSTAETNGSPVIAAWGANAKPARVAWLLDQPGAHRLQALRVTKAGAPGHPLYLPASSRPLAWPEVS